MENILLQPDRIFEGTTSRGSLLYMTYLDVIESKTLYVLDFLVAPIKEVAHYVIKLAMHVSLHFLGQ